MAREQLSNLDDWQLANERQDVRGQKLYAPDGREVGTIREMIVNTDTEYVDAIVLDDGTEIPTDDIRLDDDDGNKVFLQRDIAPPARTAPAMPTREYTVTRPRPSETTVHADEERVVPVVEEKLQVGKRKVEGGGIRVTSHVKKQPVEKEVMVRDETVNVDRRPADRPVTDADKSAMRDKTYEVHEVDEEPVVNKEAHVTEEVRINKDVERHTETVKDTVRRTDVDVEKDPERRRNP